MPFPVFRPQYASTDVGVEGWVWTLLVIVRSSQDCSRKLGEDGLGASKGDEL